MFPKAAAARAMLAQQSGRLERAVAVFAGDRRETCNLAGARAMLARVKSWQAEPDLMVELAPGFMGPNGYGPLIDLLCRDSEGLARPLRSRRPPRSARARR